MSDRVQSKEWFEQNRPEQYNYMKSIKKYCKEDNYQNHLIIGAPVKSGKRNIAEISKKIEKEHDHVFVTALHRKADEKQRKELKEQGFKVFSINTQKKLKMAIEHFRKNNNKNFIVHFDELDYGVGKRGLFQQLFKKIKDNNNTHFRLYSATPEIAFEEYNSHTGNETKKIVKAPSDFVPPPQYFGIKKYLENDRVKKADDFIKFNKEEFILTPQAISLLNQLRDSPRSKPLGIVRLAGNIKYDGESYTKFKIMKDLEPIIKERYHNKIRCKFISSKDEDKNAQWDSDEYWQELNPDFKYLYVICQVAGRSTEWRCHPYLNWYHCKRTDGTPTSTIVQDQERVNHYTSSYPEDISCILYGDMDIAKYSAEIISSDEFVLTTGRPLHGMLKKEKGKKVYSDHKYCETIDEVVQTLINNGINNINKKSVKNKHINKNNKFRKNHKIKSPGGETEYTVKDYDTMHKRYEGFYMSNIRSTKNNFIKDNKEHIPVWTRQIARRYEKVGISNATRYRIHVFYEDNETNPENYKFLVKWFIKDEDREFKNKSMYNE